MPLPAKVLEYVELFDAGRYWDAHEALEDHWRENRVDFYKGMIHALASRGGLKDRVCVTM